jgi:L-alanine-DL-glutamate epimerase-like enolase superfamily enzyme
MDIANGVIKLNGKPGLGYEMNEEELRSRAV